jgi:hypothetical protein
MVDSCPSINVRPIDPVTNLNLVLANTASKPLHKYQTNCLIACALACCCVPYTLAHPSAEWNLPSDSSSTFNMTPWMISPLHASATSRSHMHVILNQPRVISCRSTHPLGMRYVLPRHRIRTPSTITLLHRCRRSSPSSLSVELLSPI